MKFIILAILFVSNSSYSQDQYEHSDWSTWNLKGKVKTIKEYETKTTKKEISRKKSIILIDTVGIKTYTFYPSGKLKSLKSITNDGEFSGHPEYYFDTTGFLHSYRAHTTHHEELYSYTISNGKVVLKKSLDSILREDYYVYQYDELGRTISQIHYKDSISLIESIVFGYLPNGKLKFQRIVCCNSDGNNYLNWIGTKYSYSESGILTVEESFYNEQEKKYIHYYKYDSIGQMSIDSCIYTYYDNSLGWKNGSSVTKFWYDSYGNLAKRSFISSGPFSIKDTWIWDYHYDNAGNWTTKSVPNEYGNRCFRIIEYYE